MHDSRRGNSHFRSKTKVVKVHIITKISIKGNNSGKKRDASDMPARETALVTTAKPTESTVCPPVQ